MQIFVILCIVRTLSFTARVTTCQLQSGCCCSRPKHRTTEQRSFYVAVHLPTPPCSEIWSYLPAAVASACMQCIQFDDHTSRFVCLSVVWLIGYEYTAFLHGGWKTESGLICWSSRQPRCWPWVWRRVRGKRQSLAASEGCTGGVTAQLATSEKSNPMYNTHPKL